MTLPKASQTRRWAVSETTNIYSSFGTHTCRGDRNAEETVTSLQLIELLFSFIYIRRSVLVIRNIQI